MKGFRRRGRKGRERPAGEASGVGGEGDTGDEVIIVDAVEVVEEPRGVRIIVEDDEGEIAGPVGPPGSPAGAPPDTERPTREGHVGGGARDGTTPGGGRMRTGPVQDDRPRVKKRSRAVRRGPRERRPGKPREEGVAARDALGRDRRRKRPARRREEPFMTISLIAAVARNDVIGRDGQMPWDLPADLEYFRRVTMGRPVIVGRKTYEAIGQMLDGRRVFVLTRDEGFRCDDCTVVHDVVDALIYTGMIGGEVFVAGGGEVYEQFLPLAERLYITRIDADFGGDTRFPTVFWEDWREISREKGPRDERNLYDHWYIVYERKGAFGAKAWGAKGKGRPGQRRPAKSGRPGTGARRNR